MGLRHHTRLTVSLLVAGLAAVPTQVASAWADPGESNEIDDLSGIVVKVDIADGHSVTDLARDFPVTVVGPLVGSRAIYLVRATDSAIALDEKKTDRLAKDMAHSELVEYAEPNFATELADTRYHSWPKGVLEAASAGAAAWRDQAISHSLALPEVHELSTGAGTVVAVLDTGVDPGHPAVAGQLIPGYDFIDDDNDPTEQRSHLDGNGNGVVDEAFGHGTFVAGLVALIAPDARIRPYRVLDSDGVGNAFVVAQAIADAVDDGADVINISMGTSQKMKSHVVDDVLKDARRRGVVVVVAAGNAASDDRHFPAESKNVLSVTSSDDQTQGLSPFASWGDWVDLAAPADRVLGPVPGGGYAWWSGTSMAAPQVSGQVALVRSRAPHLALDRQLESITRSAVKLNSKTKVKYGGVDLLASLALADKHRE